MGIKSILAKGARMAGRGVSKGLGAVGGLGEGVGKQVKKAAVKLGGVVGKAKGKEFMGKNIGKATELVDNNMIKLAEKLGLKKVLLKMGYTDAQITSYMKSPKMRKALKGATGLGVGSGLVVSLGGGEEDEFTD